MTSFMIFLLIGAICFALLILLDYFGTDFRKLPRPAPPAAPLRYAFPPAPPESAALSREPPRQTPVTFLPE